MIPRYTPARMGGIWAEESRFRNMMEVELLACEALSNLGAVPKEAARRIRHKAGFTVEGIRRREERTRHDVVAFLGEIGSRLGKDARYLHVGLTSSDVLDTALGVQLKSAADLLLEDLARLRGVVKRAARKYRDTVCIGRTHGIHAEPTTFGLKLAAHYAELTRADEMLKAARAAVAVGKISGAVGTYAHLSPAVERHVCRKLGLRPAAISTQVVPRDGIAVFMNTLAVTGAMLERITTEIRHLQKTEVLEVEEPFGKGQTGSSAMPHKRNPVSCERVSGMARLLRADAQAAMENIALWHERDIGHSSVERVILPDATCALDFMLQETTRILKGLNVYPRRMLENLERTGGLIFSESVLLALMRAGLTREGAYRIVQKHALAAWKGGADFRARLERDAEIRRRLPRRALDDCFRLEKHLRHVKTIYRRLRI